MKLPRNELGLSIQETAELLNVTEHILSYWRTTGKGPEFIREGFHILYPAENLEEWAQKEYGRKQEEKEEKEEKYISQKVLLEHKVPEPDVECLNTSQLSGRLGISLTILCNWRIKGLGPAFFRKGHRVLYKLEDVEKWEKEEKKKGWLTTRELAKRLNRSEVTIGYWREKGKGPEYITDEHRYLYKLEEVEKWEKEQETKKNMSRTASRQRRSHIDGTGRR